jgi:glycosyltransferase involved in cell wall biosynthesis
VKVLLQADAGGVFTYALELSRALVARGVQVVLATEGARLAPDQRSAVAEVPGLVHEEAAFRLEWMEDPWEDVARAGEWLLGIARREAPDVVHLDAFSHGVLPFRAPKLVVGHSCALSWFEAMRGVPAPASWDRYRRTVAAGLRGADAVAAPSVAMAEALVRLHGPIARPAVIPNGRDPRRFPPAAKEELILGTARPCDEAAETLARAARELEWTVAIAGGEAGGEAQPGRRAPISLGRLSEQDLARWLGRAAIFAHSTRYAPSGLPVLEAALAGCALVLGDIPSLRETWDGAAAFVPPGDPDALAAALRALAARGRRRAALAAAARARALGLGPERMADAYLALYQSLRTIALGRRS